MPTRTITNLSAETTIKLSQIPNIIGIKEASGNLEQITKVINEAREGFLVWSGDDSATLPMLALGAYGVISVTSHLAGKQMVIGRYYMYKGDNIGAINRFRTVVEQYQKTTQIAEALERLTEAYYSLGLTKEAQTAAAVLGHNYPGSPWYDDSYNLLQKKNLKPEEDKGSWMSRAFDKVL